MPLSVAVDRCRRAAFDGLGSSGMETGSIVVPGRFCGPPDTGNGGYTAGLLAARTGLAGKDGIDGLGGLTGDGAAVRVTLRQPPPLESTIVVTV